MGRVALLWLLLTPLWIAFSYSASATKLAFIPPALVVIALVFYWLHDKFVLYVAGEHEPRADVQSDQSAYFRQLDQSSYSRAVAAPSLVRPAFAAIGIGACIGAAATSFFLFERELHRPLHASSVSDKSTAALATQPSSAISVQPKAVKSQLFSAEQTPSAEQNNQNTSFARSSDNADAKRAEMKIQALGQVTDQPRCNISLCESHYQSFRASDCSYQPYLGPRQYCDR